MYVNTYSHKEGYTRLSHALNQNNYNNKLITTS